MAAQREVRAGVVSDYIAAVPTMKGKEAFVSEVSSLYDYTSKGKKFWARWTPKRLAKLQAFYAWQRIIPSASPLDQLYTNEFRSIG